MSLNYGNPDINQTPKTIDTPDPKIPEEVPPMEIPGGPETQKPIPTKDTTRK